VNSHFGLLRHSKVGGTVVIPGTGADRFDT